MSKKKIVCVYMCKMFRSLLRIRRVFPILSVVTLSKDDESKVSLNPLVASFNNISMVLLAGVV